MEFSLAENLYGRFLLAGSDLISEAVKRGDGWDSDLLPIIEIAGNSRRAAIDAGANIGFFSVRMSNHFNQVLSFEPQKVIFYNLCANLLLNNSLNVRAYNLALYKGATRMSLAPRHLQDMDVPVTDDKIDYNLFGNYGAVAFDVSPGAEEVDAISIDSFYDLDVGFIKSDCQGLDFPVLLGASQTISRCRPVIIFESEMHLELGRGIMRSDYASFFSQFNYRLLIVRGGSSQKQADYLAIPRERSGEFEHYHGEVILE